MSLIAGVLAIGSLYWEETPARVNWRNARLDIDKQYSVAVPIRYGRLSRNRGNTYTMVFSRLCLRRSHGLGIGKALAFQRPVETIDQLVHEAELLWAAERQRSDPNHLLSADWGCVALLVNPVSQVPLDFLKGWENRISREPRYGLLRHTQSEGPAVTQEGFLNVPWPRIAEGGEPLPLDVVLATATDPTLVGTTMTYPRIAQIAQSWLRDSAGNDSYFWCNYQNGIRTYQDEAIINILGRR